MSPDIPAWQPIDPTNGGLSEQLDAALDSSDSPTGCVVLLVAPEIDRRWGADVSLLVARAWAAKGRSVLLADASLEDPVLHQSVDGTNDEGVSDVMLYGASVRRVARSVEGGILLASAGTPVGDAAEVLSHPKWDTVIRGFQEAGAVLLLHLSAATTGARALLDRAAGVIVLAEAAGGVSSILDSASDRIFAVLGPEAAGAEVETPLEVEVAPAGVTDEGFSLEGVAGSQYDTSDEAEPETRAPLAGAPDERESVEGVTGSAIEMDPAAVAAAAERAHLDIIKGFEAGAGFDLEDASDDLEEASDDLERSLVDEDLPDDEEVVAEDASDDSERGLVDEDLPDDEEVAAEGVLSGAAGDLAFGDPDPGSREPAAPQVTGAAPPGDPAADAGESIALAAALEAMGAGTDALPEDTVGETAVDLEEGPPREMSGLQRLDRRRRWGARVRQLLVGMSTLLIVGGGGITAAYFGFINIPGVTPPERVRSAVPPPVELPGPTPETPVISHVLIVDAWRRMETAWSTVDALRGRLPELLFFVTVIEVAGADQYALLVGPAFSAVEANALKVPLAEVLDRLNPVTWTVQEARYSFFFDEYGEAAAAAARVQSLAALSIPTHILEVSYPDGTTGLRVYGGAYVDVFQAAAMGRLLRANGLGDVRLTERRGRLPE